MTYRYTHAQQHKYRQKGAVLVMALVLLTVMTLIGVASMSSSSMQMRVASNMQQHNIVFQGAQSRLQYILSQPEGSSNAVNTKINIPYGTVTPHQIQTCNPSDGCSDSADWAATATIYYEGCSSGGFGSSAQAGKSIGIRTFEIDVTATAVGGMARSIQRQGVRGVVKDCGET